ncbi:MAG: flagellar basal-body rod protein FlgF [Candidatus Dactylopiibacterium carminicum]|uniref:Flagellar basal-body rod protein FlgF n=1 Tax=Candidatus Dactylopiibacterium carminicum TaxID=857335 RepID=A0A272EQG7_9RHOO|nr:flagellar basal-body rod protein FlgF [Candidatus Dactylopiibacterium carminicum]KAF7598532.1 flagellar basal-body rod protein FlgF [Candidatus Dactylopiibacterium carminicum]PAS92338.1 MAG: flagellar basal-body rod protein FlgF [Candidatus Dactylopiibacterium carminicum]PAS95921.1 MAG: flagellar basal-body rod protein FlgF [Candidatus Dactylopiibacterium carminicum]PAS98092.1 MAG: flagellar basal-body rod protein FlgF [Candidatus Dactylopiibacterium carminicum]
MDKLIYTAMTGAKGTMGQQAAVANNLANVSTTGFRAELHRLRAVPVRSEALPSRAFVVDATVGTDFTPGPLAYTGRTLDVAVNGQGWLAITMPNGSEAYTRSGSLVADENGVLRTQLGFEVAGDAGPIALPPDNVIEIGGDGSISAIPTDGNRNAANVVGRLKLVNPPVENLIRGEDGLFRLPAGQVAPADENVRVSGGHVEGSNVNMVEQMVTMISLTRNYETQMQMLQRAQENDRAATKVISVS